MPEVLKHFFQQFAEYWKNLEKSQKIRIYVTSAILAIAVGAGLFWLTRPNNVILVANADPKEVKEMQAILEDKGIANRIKDGNLMVDLKDSDKARFELAATGYPKHGMAFADALKLISFNSTESDKKQVWKERDRQSIITQLEMFDYVEKAEVQMVVPEQSFFDNEAKKPTAAVTIKPKDDTLTPKQVSGIKAVVSKSIEGLNTQDISVVDTTGRMFSDEEADKGMEAANSQDALRLKRKKELTDAIYDLFNIQSDSYDMVKVVVNPILDFDKQIQQSKEITTPTGGEPGTGVVDSSEVIKETVENSNTAGVPGNETNPGNEPPTYQIGTEEGGNYNKSHSIYKYRYNETQTDLEKAVGNVVPEKTTATITLMYGNRVKDANNLTQAYLDTFKTAAGTAIGVPPENISVVTLKLAPKDVVKTPLNETIKEMVNTYGFFAIMLILIVALMISAIPRRKPSEEPESELDLAADQAAVTGARFIVPDDLDPVPEIATEERSEVKKQIEKFVSQKPDAVAQLLRNWLSDEWD